MQCETFRFETGAGWSVDAFPAWDGDSTLVVVFGASRAGDLAERAAELRAAYPRAVVMGCSTAGEIFGDEVFDDSLSVAVVRFEHTALRFAVVPADTPDAGRELASKLDGDGLRAVFVLSDGLNVNGSRLATEFNDALPEGVTVTGGLAGDGTAFEQTWVLVDDKPVSQHITAVGLYGDSVQVGFGCQGGWDTFGPERLITRAEGNKLYELDGKPALDVYKRYLGDLAQDLPGTGLLFPLAIQPEPGAPELVRTILAVDEDEHSLTFAGDVPEGSRARLMRCNLDRVIEGAAHAGASTGATDQDASLSLAISCVGRRLILQHRTEEEIEGVLSNLPANTRQIGFYSYGELAPWGALKCGLHNQTMTLTTLSENRAA